MKDTDVVRCDRGNAYCDIYEMYGLSDGCKGCTYVVTHYAVINGNTGEIKEDKELTRYNKIIQTLKRKRKANTGVFVVLFAINILLYLLVHSRR